MRGMPIRRTREILSLHVAILPKSKTFRPRRSSSVSVETSYSLDVLLRVSSISLWFYVFRSMSLYNNMSIHVIYHTYIRMWQVIGGSDAMYNTCRQWQEEMMWWKEHAVCDRKWRQVQRGMPRALTLTRSAQPMNSSVSLFQCRWQGEILGLGLHREKGQ